KLFATGYANGYLGLDLGGGGESAIVAVNYNQLGTFLSEGAHTYGPAPIPIGNNPVALSSEAKGATNAEVLVALQTGGACPGCACGAVPTLDEHSHVTGTFPLPDNSEAFRVLSVNATGSAVAED